MSAPASPALQAGGPARWLAHLGLAGGIPAETLARLNGLMAPAEAAEAMSETGPGPMMNAGGTGGYLVPAGTTLGSILDDQYGLGLPPLFAIGNRAVMSRELAATYAAVYRCVTLLSGVMAGLLTSGLRVIDEQRHTVSGRGVTRLLRLLMESPNGGETAAYEWWEDLITDYMLDGNGLALIERMGGRVEQLRILRPWDAYAIDTPDGPTYTAHPDDERGVQRMASYRDIVHARWARLSSRGAIRRHFALAPISVLSRVIGLGIDADGYVSNYFTGADGGVKGKLAVVYPDAIQTDQREQIIQSLARYAQGREPLVLMGGPNITQLQDKPQDAEALQLRQFQVEEVGRVFGVPAPLLGVNVTQWGQGIEELSRIMYRFGARQHLQRLLAPLSLRLLPAGQRFAVDETELLRGDSKGLGELLAQTLGGPNGPAVLSIEEARHLLGFPPENVPEQPQAPAPPEPAGDLGETPTGSDEGMGDGETQDC